jgi:DNA replication protein DnaC
LDSFDKLLAALPQTPDPEPCPDHHITPEARGETCPSCKAALAQAQAEHARAVWAFRWWRDESGIPSRFASKTVAGWRPAGKPNQQAHDLVTRYSQAIKPQAEAGRGIVLLGPVGTGKTHLLAALTADAIEAGMRARYAVWPSLIARHRDAQADRKHADRDLLEALANCELLALDELGLTELTPWQAGELFRLIDARYREQLPTLIAANLTAATLAPALGERVADRLRDACAVLTLAGESQRGKPQSDGPPRFQMPEAATVRVWAGHRWAERNVDGERWVHGRREL